MSGKVQLISVICFLSYCVIIGALVFSRGFLLNRQVITSKAGPCLDTSLSTQQNAYHSEGYHHPNQSSSKEELELLANLTQAANWCQRSPPLFKKAILVLVDALRYDFVRRMPFLREMVKRQQQKRMEEDLEGKRRRFGGDTKFNGDMEQAEQSTCLFRFVADPPTTTMQRLKALMTGTMPTFIDASANFNSYEVEEDSLIHQLFTNNHRLAFLGDDTWLSLFPARYFTSPHVEAHPSFNAWDLDTVDRAVNLTLRTKIFPGEKSNLSSSSSSSSSFQWDVLITHLLGVDHCGHRYGPQHPEMTRKLLESDAILQFIYKEMSADTLLVVFGDHGMTSTGDHGGDSQEETNSALLLLTKSLKFQCPDPEHAPGLSQIDLVPTLAFFLGVPVPYSSIGSLLPNILPPEKRHLYTDALSANAAQVATYIQNLGLVNSPTLLEDYQRLNQAYFDYQLARTNLSSRARLHTLATRYLLQVKQLATSTWTQFNVPMIYTGVLISGLASLSLCIYLWNCPKLNLVSTQYSVLSWLWPSLPVWSVLWTFAASSPTSSNLLAIIISTVAGLLMFLLLLLGKILSTSNKVSTSVSLCDLVGLLLYSLTCFAMFSNSFVINEPYLLGSILLLITFLHIFLSSSPPPSPPMLFSFLLSRKRIECSLSCLLILAILLRTCSIFFRCREELQSCSEEYLLHKQLASLPESWLVLKYLRYSIALLSLAIFVVAFRLWMLYRRVLFSNSLPASLIAKFIPSLLVVLLGVFWALQGLPFLKTTSSSSSKLRPILNNFPLAFQISTLVSLVLVYIRPLFTSKANPQLPTHLSSNGFIKSSSSSSSSISNGYLPLPTTISSPSSSSSALDPPPPTSPADSILLFTTLVIILLSQITSVGIAPTVSILIPYMIVSLVGIFRTCPPSSWCPPLVWTLTSQYMFYGTGHQPIFSAIPWDSAFLSGNDGQSFTEAQDSVLTWLRPAFAVMGNLHVSQIIFSLAMPLLAYWGPGAIGTEETSQSCQRRRQNAYLLSGKFLMLHGLKLFCCMACAGWHRRHLMVWKIFAPKFIFELVSFIVTMFSTVFTLVFVTRIDYLYHRNNT